MKINGESYLFFLRLTPELPEIYFHLNQAFRQKHIRLIPVTPNDLKEIHGGQRLDILCFTPDMLSRKVFLRFRSTYLDYCMNAGSVRLFELTSFSKNTGYYRQEKRGTYLSLPLPISSDEVVEAIFENLKKDPEISALWPGGRRGKLPTV